MKNLKIFLMLLVLAVNFTILNTSVLIAEESKVCKIGAILPLTGNLGFIGQDERKGFEMAKNIINNSGGINGKKLEIVYGDSQGKAKEGVNLFNKFTAMDKLSIIISSTSSVTNALIPLSERSNVILFAITIQPYVTEGKNNIFRVWPDSELEWKLLLKYIEDNKLTKVGMFYVNAEYGLLCKKYFEERLPGIGAELKYAEAVKLGQTDYRSQIFKVKKKDVDRTLIICYPGDAIKLIKQLRESGVQVPLLSYLTFTYDFLRKAVKNEASGTVFTAPAFSIGILNEAGNNFIKKVEETYNEKPNWDTAFSYDLVSIISTAMNKAKSENLQAIKKALHGIQKYEGVTGEISIKENNDSQTSLYLAVFKNGQVTLYEK